MSRRDRISAFFDCHKGCGDCLFMFVGSVKILGRPNGLLEDGRCPGQSGRIICRGRLTPRPQRGDLLHDSGKNAGAGTRGNLV